MVSQNVPRYLRMATYTKVSQYASRYLRMRNHVRRTPGQHEASTVNINVHISPLWAQEDALWPDPPQRSPHPFLLWCLSPAASPAAGQDNIGWIPRQTQSPTNISKRLFIWICPCWQWLCREDGKKIDWVQGAICCTACVWEIALRRLSLWQRRGLGQRARQCSWLYIDGLVQERRNSIANSLELRLSCTDLSIKF